MALQTLACCEPAQGPMSRSNFSRALVALSLNVPLSVKAAPVYVLAQVPADLKDKFSSSLGVVFIIGFIWGVINIWSGANKLKHGDSEGKMGIVSGIIIAGGAALMGAFFAIFGMSDGSLTPRF
jgi:hypothetical protein